MSAARFHRSIDLIVRLCAAAAARAGGGGTIHNAVLPVGVPPTGVAYPVEANEIVGAGGTSRTAGSAPGNERDGAPTVDAGVALLAHVHGGLADFSGSDDGPVPGGPLALRIDALVAGSADVSVLDVAVPAARDQIRPGRPGGPLAPRVDAKIALGADVSVPDVAIPTAWDGPSGSGANSIDAGRAPYASIDAGAAGSAAGNRPAGRRPADPAEASVAHDAGVKVRITVVAGADNAPCCRSRRDGAFALTGAFAARLDGRAGLPPCPAAAPGNASPVATEIKSIVAVIGKVGREIVEPWGLLSTTC